MGDYHVLCDESHIGCQHTYRVQGGVWANHAGMRAIRAEFKRLRKDHPNTGEFKWSHVHGQTPYRAYVDLIKLFFTGPAAPYLSFKCLVVERTDDPSRGLGKEGRDLGFYKAYFTLLRYRLEPGCRYRIKLDQRTSPRDDPETELMDCLNAVVRWWEPPAEILSCASICSKSDNLMQLSDVLCGAVAWAWNGRNSTSPAKQLLAQQIEAQIPGRKLEQQTAGKAVKFNVWRYSPKKK